MAPPEANEAYFAREAQLKKQLEEGFPESWKPKDPGETLIGIFVNRDTGHTQYGPKYIVVLENAVTHERTSVWLLHTALESQFRRAAPKIGEMVAIRYEGKVRPASGGAEYDNWTVRVDRPEATDFDWSAPPGATVGQRAGDRPPPSGEATEARYAPPPDDDDIPF